MLKLVNRPRYIIILSRAENQVHRSRGQYQPRDFLQILCYEYRIQSQRNEELSRICKVSAIILVLYATSENDEITEIKFKKHYIALQW